MLLGSNSAGIVKRLQTIAATLATYALCAPTAMANVRVFGCELVPVFAVSHCEPSGSSQRSSDVANADSTLQVGRPRDGFQMRGIDATRNATQVVELETVWNRALVFHVGNAMSKLWNGMSALSHSEPAISLSVKLASPKPAIVCVDGDFSKDPLQKRAGRHSHSLSLASSAVYLMLQSILYDVQQATTEAFNSGLLMSLCTIQVPSGNKGPSGSPDNTWIAYAGVPAAIPCMDAVTAASVQATEAKALAEIESKGLRHVLLDACYPQLVALKLSGMQVRALITDPTGQTITYEVLGFEDDSQSTQTRFECQKVST